MTQKIEQWLLIAREIVRGAYLPAEIPREQLFDKEAESKALAEWLASHAPSEAAAQPTCVVCGHPEHTDEHAGISHLPVSKAHAFQAEIEHNDH